VGFNRNAYERDRDTALSWLRTLSTKTSIRSDRDEMEGDFEDGTEESAPNYGLRGVRSLQNAKQPEHERRVTFSPYRQNVVTSHVTTQRGLTVRPRNRLSRTFFTESTFAISGHRSANKTLALCSSSPIDVHCSLLCYDTIHQFST
jgi:hypothetical protein